MSITLPTGRGRHREVKCLANSENQTQKGKGSSCFTSCMALGTLLHRSRPQFLPSLPLPSSDIVRACGNLGRVLVAVPAQGKSWGRVCGRGAQAGSKAELADRSGSSAPRMPWARLTRGPVQSPHLPHLHVQSHRPSRAGCVRCGASVFGPVPWDSCPVPSRMPSR